MDLLTIPPPPLNNKVRLHASMGLHVCLHISMCVCGFFFLQEATRAVAAEWGLYDETRRQFEVSYR